MGQYIYDTFECYINDKISDIQKIKYGKSEVDYFIYEVTNDGKIIISIDLYQYIVIDSGLCEGDLVPLSSELGNIVAYKRSYDLPQIYDDVTWGILGTTYSMEANDKRVKMKTELVFIIK